MKRSLLVLGLITLCIVLVAMEQTSAQPRRRSQRVVTSLTDVIWAVQFSPDGRTLAIARGTSDAGRVELWDVESGKLKQSIKGFDGVVWSISFTLDSGTLVSASGGFHSNKIADKPGRRNRTRFVELKWWDTQTGDLKQRVELPGEDRISLLAVHSPDGRFLITVEYRVSIGMFAGYGSGFYDLNRSTISGVTPIFRPPVYETELKLLDARTGELQFKFKGNLGSSELPFFPGSSYDWTSLMNRGRQPIALSPDGQMMASWNTRAVKIWSMATGEEIRKLKDFKGYLSSAAFSPDGRTLAAVITRYSFKENRYDIKSEIRTWDVPSGSPKQVVPVSTQSSTSLVFALNGRQLLVSGTGRDDGRPYATLELADLQSGSLGKIATREEGNASSAVLSPDGRMVAFQTDASSVYLVDTANWKIKQTFNENSDSSFVNNAARRFLLSVKNVTTLAFSADGKTVTGEIEQGGIKLWDARTGEVKKQLGDQDETGSTAAISTNGSIVVETGGEDGTLRIWNLATGEKKNISTDQGAITALAVSADGQRLAVAHPHTIALLNATTGELLKTLNVQTTKVDCLSLAADGRTLALGEEEGTIQILDLTTGQITRSLNTGVKITALRYAPASRTLASANGSGVVSLWDLQTGSLTLQLKKHSGAVNAIAFSADGSWLATGGDDRSVIIWDVATGKAQRTMKGHDLTVTSIAFSPDGSLLASGAGNASIVLWDLPSGKLNRVMK